MSELTPAMLYDELQRRFGIGDWDEATSRIPFFKARMVEIGKLKRMLSSRRTKPEEVLLAAEYAAAHKIPVQATWELFSLISDAKREQRQKVVATDVQTRLAEAMEEAVALGEQGWAERLYAADPRAGEDLLAAWTVRKGALLA